MRPSRDVIWNNDINGDANFAPPTHLRDKELAMRRNSTHRERRHFAVQLTLLVALLTFASAAAHAGLNGDMLSVKTREGKDLQIKLSEQTAVAAAKAMKLEDLKAGD
jgi:hypothetical protein